MMDFKPEVIVVADDFTGSNDTGVQLSKYGLPAVTVLDTGDIKKYSNYAGLVIDTESRTLSPADAVKRVSEAAGYIKKICHEVCVYKKVDSILRGNIGLEIGILAELLKPEIIVFAPAFPKNGRTTVRGLHYVNGKPVSETEAAADPITPVRTSSVETIAGNGNRLDFKLIELESIRRGFIPEIAGRGGAFCFDCETDEDLFKIVRDVSSSGKSVLWCGSAGLADALMKYRCGSSSDASFKKKHSEMTAVTFKDDGSCETESGVKKPFLGVIGSTAGVNAQQIYAASEFASMNGRRPLHLLFIDNIKLLGNPEQESERITDEVIRLFDSGTDVIIASAVTEKQRELLSGSSSGSSINKSEGGFIRISQLTGALAAAIIKKRKPRGIFATGGETSLHLVKSLNVKAFSIEKELEPGVPVIHTLGRGDCDIRMVTKAGAFGSSEIIIKAMQLFEEEADLGK